MLEKILVAMDGSEPAQRALEYAEEFSIKWDSEMIILTVIPTIVIPQYIRTRPVMTELEKALEDAYKIILTKASEKVKNDHPEINFLTRLEKGRPPDVIVEVGLKENVDLIVMGSRGIGGVSAILGSTSRLVVETWIKPIFLVR